MRWIMRGCLVVGGIFVALVVLGLIVSPRNRTSTQGTQRAAAPMPNPTTPAVPSPTVIVSTPQPAATESPEARYLAIARRAALPGSRAASDTGWKAEHMDIGNGPEVHVTMPLNEAFSNEQFVRLAKQSIAQVIGALFEADPELARVGVIGTYPTGDQELPAVSVWARRSAATNWGAVSGVALDRVAESIDIKPRYQP